MNLFYAHNHTDGSNFKGKDSINKTKNLIDYSLEIGSKGLAITDHETITNSVKAIKYVKELTKQGKIPDDWRLGLGNEIYLIDKDVENLLKENNDYIKYYHLILIAKDKQGFDLIRELSSEAWINSYHYKGTQRTPTYKHTFKEILSKNKGHVICSTACLGGEFANLVLKFNRTKDNKDKIAIHKFLKFMLEIFGEDFYIELQPSPNEDQKIFNKLALNIAKAYGIKAIITTDTHYLKKEHRIFHKYYLQSQNAEREVDDFYATTYMMKKEEMIEYIDENILDEICDNTLEIRDKIEHYDLFMEEQIPKTFIEKHEVKHIFKNHYTNNPYIYNYANSKYEIDRYFLSLIEDGFINKNIQFTEENISRINTELKELWLLSEMKNQRAGSYYITIKDLIDIMWEISYVGISRGSSSGFFICYLLDIVQLNPIKHNLPYWRHLTADRGDWPDIDVDSQPSKRQEIVDLVRQKYEKDGVRRVINCCTHTTEKAKSSIATACRGLEIEDNIAQHIKDMVDSKLTLSQAFYGDEEEDIKPVEGLIDELKKHEGLFEIVEMFEGLISGRSQHAAGVFIISEGINSQNAIMRTSSGKMVTQFNYDDSLYCGCMKYDFLSINALDKIRDNVELLIKKGKIKRQGTLRETYNKYIHPDVLEWEAREMYEMLYKGEIIDGFQFDTVQGAKAIKKIIPYTFKELEDGNSLMRLSCNGEQPIDRFVRFKQNIELWFIEMEDSNLLEKEKNALKELLLKSYGTAVTQEDAMEISMHKDIANFTIAEANKLRKAIAKKKDDLFNQAHDKFIAKGVENGNRKEFLEYTWEKYILPQKGYSFSRLHVAPYTGILLQEMNLAYRYGSIFWKTVVLSNAGGIINDEISSGADYSTISKVISRLNGMVSAPDINLSDIGFTPLEKENKILFGLNSISGIGTREIEMINLNKPYKSFDDFTRRSGLTQNKIITLIKSGAFDRIENGIDRKDLMVKYVSQSVPVLEKLTMSHYKKLKNTIPENLKPFAIVYDYLNINCQNLKGEKFVKIKNPGNEDMLNFLLEDPTKYSYEDNFIKMDKTYYNKKFEQVIDKIKNWLNSEEIIENYNKEILRSFWKEKCLGTKESWEMETTIFYHDKHELDYYDFSLYKIANFYNLSFEPSIERTETTKRGFVKKFFKIDNIIGTVIEKDKPKKKITVLTQNGAIVVKVPDNLFLKLDNVISKGEKKEKVILDDSWFKRGTKLMLTGYRKGDEFRLKTYSHDLVVIQKIVGRNVNNRPVLVNKKLT